MQWIFWPLRMIRALAHGSYDKQLTLEEQLALRTAEVEQLRVELKELKEQASKDSLTKLANRPAFLEALKSAIIRARTNLQHLILMMIDIDHFKDINDQHGHLAGDMALQSFGTLLSSCMTQTAIAARYGGEEFAVILPDIDLPEAMRITDSLREGLTNFKLQTMEGTAPDVQLTVSIGIAQFRHIDDVRHLIDRADRALYAAKQEGRDCVRTSTIS